MKFTPTVILDAPSYYVDFFHKKQNVDKCTILRDLDLENDSVVMPSCMALLTRPTHILDLTNNSLIDFPDLHDRTDIHTLLLGRNRINGTINGKRLPKDLKNLVLASNDIKELSELNGLQSAPKSLNTISLLGNQICHLEGYRTYVLTILPNLRNLDFTKISDLERTNLKKKPVLIIKNDKNTKVVKSKKSHDKSTEMMNFVVNKMTDERKLELKKQLAEAVSLDEIIKIEKQLAGGI
ncbi:similar to Saccharomyces cerevisiae YPL213W LEA1 Component of U2 snRNP [Maudiozyma barnettii]|uniref:U2 small nuclear ribonucleoprotein A' n=1 Tax=Maudiozyma barnettii TaxID=61262 RepID=A0A8H2VH25_9SACH|nr:U2 snRNP complex subunit LEA1 [Kazachstania barnettii]CAB4255357.1 similar to Saccharomyces cerevisiae YPL213W LEA1 Component of U2 snRNP [Kazachstania barnettii]CAD1783763.1 similar to Saccharomyces cerevisiae YPL213W LEA1 Component of U2 snRNP [Kazachstania barnettii]